MITRPSTQRLIGDLVTELEREILPFLPEGVPQIRLHMIMAVMGHCAIRSGNETAWMTEEAAAYLEYANDVADVTGSEEVRAAIARVTPFTDLRLNAVSTNYSRASEALSVALDAAQDQESSELVHRGEELLRMRVANEQAVTGATEYEGR